jgi:hypothetical protein
MRRFVFPLLLLGIATASEDVMAQNTMGPIIGNQGIITQGQQGNNTIIQAPVRAQFTDQIKSEILQKIPKGTVDLRTIGGEADQAIGNEVHQFLMQNGYNVQRSIIGMMAPPPDRPFSANTNGSNTVFTVAPSAR